MFMFQLSAVPSTIPVSKEALQCVQTYLKEQYASELRAVREEEMKRRRKKASSSMQLSLSSSSSVSSALTVSSSQNNKQQQNFKDDVPPLTSEDRKNLTLVFKQALLSILSAKRVHKERQRRESVQTFKSDFDAFWKQKQEMNERARIQALRHNDTEGYLQHLSNMKVTSLLSIMETTHEFMTKIGAQLQKKGSEEGNPTTASTTATSTTARDKSSNNNVNEDYRRFKEYVASTKDEYKLVHRTEVFVAEQPKGISATLMPHQIVGLRFLASLFANKINGILADEMGVGKTLQTLSFLCYLKESPSLRINGPHLVLAPLSIVREWKEAIATFVTGLTVTTFEELEEERDAYKFNIVLLAVHRVRHFTNELQHVTWRFLIVDEAHKAVSNPETLTASAIRSIPARNRLVLTGTPLNNDIQELWSLLNFINPDVFEERTSFEEVFRRPFLQAGHIPEDAKLTEEERELLILRMHQILRPFMLRRTKKDIDSSLKITYHELLCPLSFVQKKILNYIRQQSLVPVLINHGHTYALQPVGVKEKCAQAICNHPFMITFFSQLLLKEERKGKRPCSKHSQGLWALQSSGKFVVLDLILRRMRLVGRKVVIFSHWLDTVDLLQEYMEFRGWTAEAKNYVVLTGASSQEERQECVFQFRENPETLIMILSIKAGGCGLNLQVASTVIMFDKDYTATNEDQAVARVFRIGQTQTVRAIYLVTKDMTERRVADIAERKNKPRQAIIEGGTYNEQAITEEERQEALQQSLVNLKDVMDLTNLGEFNTMMGNEKEESCCGGNKNQQLQTEKENISEIKKTNGDGKISHKSDDDAAAVQEKENDKNTKQDVEQENGAIDGAALQSTPERALPTTAAVFDIDDATPAAVVKKKGRGRPKKIVQPEASGTENNNAAVDEQKVMGLCNNSSSSSLHCKNGHVMQYINQPPNASYGDDYCCDDCDEQDTFTHSPGYNCIMCEYDLCLACAENKMKQKSNAVVENHDDEQEQDHHTSRLICTLSQKHVQQLHEHTTSTAEAQEKDQCEAVEDEAEEESLLVHQLDPLLYGNNEDLLTTLQTTEDLFEKLFKEEKEMPICFQEAFLRCEEPEDLSEYGKGKRRGGADSDDDDPLGLRDMPPEAYLDKYLDEGFSEEEIVDMYRKEQSRKEQRKCHAVDVVFQPPTAKSAGELTSQRSSDAATMKEANTATLPLSSQKSKEELEMVSVLLRRGTAAVKNAMAIW